MKPTVPVVVGEHPGVAVAQLERGLPLPRLGHPLDLGELVVAVLAGEHPKRPAGPDAGQLRGVAGQQQLGARPPGRGVQGGQVGGRHRAGLVDDEQVAGRQHGLAAGGGREEPGDVAGLADALGGEDLGGVLGRRHAYDVPAGVLAPQAGEGAHRAGLPGPGRADQDVHGRPLVMMPNTAAAWSPRSPPCQRRPRRGLVFFSVGDRRGGGRGHAAGQRREAGGVGAERGGDPGGAGGGAGGLPGGGHQLFLGVQVRPGGEQAPVVRGVDAAPVGAGQRGGHGHQAGGFQADHAVPGQGPAGEVIQDVADGGGVQAAEPAGQVRVDRREQLGAGPHGVPGLDVADGGPQDAVQFRPGELVDPGRGGVLGAEYAARDRVERAELGGAHLPGPPSSISSRAGACARFGFARRPASVTYWAMLNSARAFGARPWRAS